MKKNLFLLFVIACLFPAVRSDAANFSVTLATPQLLTLQTTIPVGSNNLPVQLTFLYNTKGQIIGAAGSTVDGIAATCVGTETKSGANINYSLTIKAASTPATTISLRGVVGSGQARCTYKGPKGRATIASQPVAVTSATPTQARVDLSSTVNTRNQISGTGSIFAFGTNGATAGKLKGTVSTNKLTLTLTQSPRMVSFTGTRSNDVYLGALKVTAPPARETIQPFAVPASAFFTVAGSAAAFRGVVLVASNAAPSPAAGAQVTIKSDLNGDGRFTGTEVATATADAQGRYQLSFPVLASRSVMVEMSLAGFAKNLTSYPEVVPGAIVTRNATLQSLTPLALDGGTAQSSDGRIMLTGLPSTITNIGARVFNPVTETAQFPGQFMDSQSNLLVSSVFSAIEARNSSGGLVTNLGTNALLCMEVPRDTWNTMGDLTAGNGQIDIPLYFYDESSGEWRRNPSNGWLEDSNHVRIAETQLAAILNGSYSGRIFGAGPITHLSYWNIDWPVDSHTSVRGTIVDEEGRPISGVTVTVRGLTYTGSSGPEVTADDGVFCIEVMRSEEAGEDLDRDGIVAETQQVQITVQNGTNLFSFGPYNCPKVQGTCATGGGLLAGLLSLVESNRLTLTSCTVTGRVLYSGISNGGVSSLNAGDPIVGATVIAVDPEAGILGVPSPCTNGLSCNYGITDESGRFILTASVLSGVTVYATRTDTAGSSGTEYYYGATSFSGCPTTPFTLSADFTSFRFLIMTLAGPGINDSVFSLINDQPTVVLVAGTFIYTATPTAPASRPTTTGPWLTLNLINAVTAMPAGTITFTVNSLSPVSGTWTTSTLGLSGTFTESGTEE